MENTLLTLQTRLSKLAGQPEQLVLMPDEGLAVLVDLEKMRYSLALLDLAHATPYTSTSWDIESIPALA